MKNEKPTKLDKLIEDTDCYPENSQNHRWHLELLAIKKEHEEKITDLQDEIISLENRIENLDCREDY